jgi:hypothetical protein
MADSNPLISPELHQIVVRLNMDFQAADLAYNQALDNLVRHHKPEVWDAYAILTYVNSNRNRWTTSAPLNKHFILSFFRRGGGVEWKLSDEPDIFIRLVDEISVEPREKLPFLFRNVRKKFETEREKPVKEFRYKEYKTFDI